MSVGWGMNATVGWTLWQFNLAAIARGEGAAAAVVADHEGFGAMNAAEEGSVEHLPCLQRNQSSIFLTCFVGVMLRLLSFFLHTARTRAQFMR